jgi:hypothetical protein
LLPFATTKEKRNRVIFMQQAVLNNTKIAIRWLRSKISSLDYGIKYKGHPIHLNSNVSTMAFLNGERKYLFRPTNKEFEDHFENKETLYFTGNNRGPAIIMLDIDCHKMGSLAGALAFAQHLKDNFFPDLYYEVSTNGNGVHGYIIFNESRPSNHKVWLKTLEKVLDGYLTLHPFDVEMIEIKGLPPTIKWKNHKVLNYVAGTLAKMPRQVERFEELMNTTSLDLDQLLDTIEKIKKATPKVQETKPELVKPSVRIRGNVSNPFGSTDKLEQIKPLARKICYSYGKKLNIEDTTIGLYILFWMKTHPTYRKDGSLPQLRIRAIWEVMFQEGTVTRQFRAERWKEIRKMLTSFGVIVWQDTRYYPQQAMKGEMSDEMHKEINLGKKKTYALGQVINLVIISNPPMPINCWGLIMLPDQNFDFDSRNRLIEMGKEVLMMMKHAA